MRHSVAWPCELWLCVCVCVCVCVYLCTCVYKYGSFVFFPCCAAQSTGSCVCTEIAVSVGGSTGLTVTSATSPETNIGKKQTHIRTIITLNVQQHCKLASTVPLQDIQQFCPDHTSHQKTGVRFTSPPLGLSLSSLYFVLHQFPSLHCCLKIIITL